MTFSKDYKNYYSLAKPGIIYGNLLTALAGYLFASHWHNNYGQLISMLVGLALIIGCGCVLNNILDRKIDKVMERTKKRATVTGKIKPLQALIYGSILGALGTIILGLFTNVLTMLVALFGLVVYVAIYGLAKRKTVYGTLVGAIAGAVPPLVGYTSFTNFIDLGGVLLFFILVCWQLTHFYGIALYRKKDYAEAKIPVWPVVKGDWSTQLQAIGFIAVFTIFMISLFVFGYAGLTYLIAAFILGLGWLWYSVTQASKLQPVAWGKKIFVSSLSVIIILSVLLAIGPILP